MAKNKGKQKKKDYAPRVRNRKALHDYHISDKLECGIVLSGSEVKAIREGRATLSEGYCLIDERRDELWLHNVDIGQYSHAGGANGHENRRKRKLLAKKREIRSLIGKVSMKGVTLAPLEMYFSSRGFVKVQIGVAEGKSRGDKREDIKKKQADRDMRRAMSRKRIG